MGCVRQAPGMTAPMPVGLRTRPFRSADAYAAGLGHHHLRTRRFRRLFHDVYVCADVRDSLQLWCDAATLVAPVEAVFSHGTAAQLYQLPLPTALTHHSSRNGYAAQAGERSLHMTVGGSEPSFRSRGIVAHQSALSPDDICHRDGALDHAWSHVPRPGGRPGSVRPRRPR